MDPKALLQHLEAWCADHDAGRRPSRPSFAPSRAAVVALLGLSAAACGDKDAVALYAAPADTAEEDCTNEVDDDFDDAVDCDDPDCDADEACADVALYKAP